jgi:amino acid adenylation domain-containing protein
MLQAAGTQTPTATHSPQSLALREAADTRPNGIAIQVDDQTVTFAELNAQADRLAQALIEEGLGDGDRVALRTNGSHATVVGFVAIQRAGMVSVPVDPTAPEDRVRQILADVEAEVLLTDVDGDENLPLLTGHPLTFGAALEPVAIDRPRGELVSIVFTSGSTGTPKGIMVGRAQMDQTFVILPELVSPPGTRLGGLVAGTTGYIERLVAAVLVRQSTLVCYEIRRHGIVPLASWLERERIAAFATVPTVLRHLLSTLSPEQRFPDLQIVVLSGETATWEDVTRLRAHLSPEAIIVNAFGLTEAAGIATLVITSDMPAGEGPLPAGELAPTAKVTIVGDDGEPVAQGEPGEIVAEGPGCALGYWRRADLTESVFTVLENGDRRVRTGDGGRIRDDGMLEHLGRLDHLVKISGNRVELGEVESALARLDGVAAAAAATYVDDTQSTRLTACVMPRAGASLDARVLRSQLSRRLPGYMIPDHIAVVDELPQLVAGKTDRARVAEMRGTGAPGGVEADGEQSELERSLAAIWCDVLDVKSVGLQDDFFELGGDSIRAARLFVELEQRHGIDRPMSLLMEAPTVASLALALADDPGWDALLAVQTSGSRPPLFVVHDGTGSLSCGRAMAAGLGPDQPLYGIRCAELNGQPLRATSVEELARSYTERIRALYPHGPYVLYGVSFGGLVAIEMSRQLKAAGEDVPVTILGDTWAPIALRPRLALRERLAVRLGEMRRMSAGERVRRVIWLAKRQFAHRVVRAGSDARTERQQLRMLARAIRRGEPVPVEARGRHVLQQYAGLMAEHQVRPPFPERVLLLRTDGPGDVPDRGWRVLVGDALEIVDVPGSHIDLGREVSGAYVAPVLAQALNHVL